MNELEIKCIYSKIHFEIYATTPMTFASLAHSRYLKMEMELRYVYMCNELVTKCLCKFVGICLWKNSCSWLIRKEKFIVMKDFNADKRNFTHRILLGNSLIIYKLYLSWAWKERGFRLALLSIKHTMVTEKYFLNIF